MRALRARLQAGTVFSLMAAGVLAVTTVSAPATATTLEEALSEAYTTNPQLLAERARQRATDELVSQAVSGWRPSVTVQRPEPTPVSAPQPRASGALPGFLVGFLVVLAIGLVAMFLL